MLSDLQLVWQYLTEVCAGWGGGGVLHTTGRSHKGALKVGCGWATAAAAGGRRVKGWSAVARAQPVLIAPRRPAGALSTLTATPLAFW